MTKVRKKLQKIYQCRMLYFMLLPSIVAIFIFHYIPLYGVQIAFKDYRSSLGIWGSEWVGLKHFKYFVFEYPYFTKVLINTLRVSLLGLCIFPIPVVFAIMLNEMRNLKIKKVCQMITYAPHFVSTVVVCSMIVLFTNKDGLVNVITGFFGVEPKDYMAMPSAFAPIYVVSDLWSELGWNTIIYLSTLSGVSPELIEAAEIDGAGRLQTILHVQLPHLMPTVVMMFILRMGSLLSVGFEKTFLLQNDLNMEKSSVISTYVYQVGIISHQFSYSAAIGLFNNIINIILIVAANTVSKKAADVSLF